MRLTIFDWMLVNTRYHRLLIKLSPVARTKFSEEVVFQVVNRAPHARSPCDRNETRLLLIVYD